MEKPGPPRYDGQQLCGRLAFGHARQATICLPGYRPGSRQVVAAQGGSGRQMKFGE